MDGTRGDPAEPGDGAPLVRPGDHDPTVPAAERSGPDAAPVESYGPLELRRLRKDDGRALIVYSRAERGR